jgi:hypothetical protein
MSEDNRPRTISISVLPETHDRHNAKREALGKTWYEYIIPAVEAVYFG